MRLSGPAAQRPGRESPEVLIISSGPVVLSVSRLAPAQQQLIHRILSLRSPGRSDSQIANHLNETGDRIPDASGLQMDPAEYFSERKKYEKRLKRLGKES